MLKLLPFRSFTSTLKTNLNRPLCARFISNTSGQIPIISDENASFESYLRKRIKMKGPLTVAEYMKEALGNPKWGYYMKKDVFGSKGDFITSPEVSQMFGELIGVWFLNEWQVLKDLYGENLPKEVQLVELGPGRGTLMNDVLKVWSQSKAIKIKSSDLHVHMVESSPFMRKTQLKNLCGIENVEPVIGERYKSKYTDSIQVSWVNDLSMVPKIDVPQFFLANEFFDALPIQKFQKTSEGHKEVLVGLNAATQNLEFKISKSRTIGSNVYLKMYPNYQDHEHVEVSMDSARNLELIANRINETNGSMLVIDYGHDGECKDTFRAFKSHKLVDNVFLTPGECDLTADVDFAFLKHVAKARNVNCYGPTSQEKFLNQMQIHTRFKQLFQKTDKEDERSKLVADLAMLTEKEKMGERFKFMAIRKFNLEYPPAGFIPE